MSSVGNPWSSLTAVQKAMLAIGVPASAVVVYILYRRFRESRDEPYVLVGDDQIAMDMRVPRDAVKIIIGRQGSTIKQLRKETGARIEVEDSEETGGYEGPAERVLTVVGSPVQVCKAKVAIHQLLADSMKITEELHVPHRAVGRIIGRGGESIREICRTTGAKIVCEKETSEQILDTRRSVKISGTKQEVASARALIVAKVEEEETFRQKLASSAARRRQRKHPIGARTEQVSPTHSGEGIAASPASEGGEWALDTSEDEVDHRTNPTITTEQEKEEGASEKDGQPGNHSSQVSKFEIPSPDFSFLPDEHLEVYVSASENPNHFWIQILGSRCLQLDNLTYEMSRYYRSCSGMREDFTPKLGDIVAAPFQGDSSWYRARVLSFLESGIADLYYVDYGDNGEIPIGKLQILRTDFLSLPFQAVECSLDEIQPVGEVWSDEAMNCFDCLTYCAEWKVLLARICSYSQSGDVTRPQVKLFDRTRDQNLDIGEELIRLGHATRCPQTPGATVGDGLGAGGKSTTTTLQALLNDVAGGLDGSLVSELCTRSPEEQLSTSWQTYSEPSLYGSEGVLMVKDEFL
ncbi:tudor and KH domain-containing protein-like [Heterodontus francisci]|uniref:tudor and KH domain-containing protein-like n=1 Tax=Heterodontus francisci TaxID=7792 RepID=UPI00355B9A3C